MSMCKKLVASLIFVSSCPPAMAVTINIDTLMQSNANNALSQRYNSCLAGSSSLVKKITCEIISGGRPPATISNVTVTANGLGTSNITISPLPTSVDNISTWSFNNCLDVSYPINQKITATATENLTLQKKTTIVTEKSVSINGEYNFAVAKVGGSANVKQIITNESGSTFVTSNSKTVEETINISVPPRTMYVFSVEAVKYAATMDYFGDVLLDGQVLGTFSGSCKNNNTGGPCYRQYSALVPNNSVAINGSILSSYVSSTKWNYKQYPATNCSVSMQKSSQLTSLSGSRAASLSKKTTSKQPNVELVDLNNNYIEAGYNSTTPKQVIKPVGNGLQVTTANVVGSVQMRAKSRSTEVCEANFIVSDKQQKTSVAPNTWSDWVTVDTYSGTTVSFVSIQDSCGGKVDAEVKYFE